MLEVKTVDTEGDLSPVSLKRFISAIICSQPVWSWMKMVWYISYEEYHPYGTTAYQAMDSTINAAAKRYRYTGKERDEESGLNYHGARYYALWLCRWVAVDPKESERIGLSSFDYCSNNPINKVDLDGMKDHKKDEKPTTKQNIYVLRHLL